MRLASTLDDGRVSGNGCRGNGPLALALCHVLRVRAHLAGDTIDHHFGGYVRHLDHRHAHYIKGCVVYDVLTPPPLWVGWLGNPTNV